MNISVETKEDVSYFYNNNELLGTLRYKRWLLLKRPYDAVFTSNKNEVFDVKSVGFSKNRIVVKNNKQEDLVSMCTVWPWKKSKLKIKNFDYYWNFKLGDQPLGEKGILLIEDRNSTVTATFTCLIDNLEEETTVIEVNEKCFGNESLAVAVFGFCWLDLEMHPSWGA